MNIRFWFVGILLMAHGAHADFSDIFELKNKPSYQKLDRGEMDVSYSFTDWESHWVKQKGNLLLQPIQKFELPKEEPALRMFHGRVFVVIDKSWQSLKKKNYLSLEFFRYLDPDAQYSPLAKSDAKSKAGNWCSQMCFQAEIPLPMGMSSLMNIAGMGDHLSEHNNGGLAVQSDVQFFERSTMPEFVKTQIFSLHPVPQVFRFAVRQNGFYINQMGLFTNSLISVYEYSPNQSMVVLDLTFALEEDIDKMVSNVIRTDGIFGDYFGDATKGITQNVFFGDYGLLATETGIGQGIVGYMEDIAENLQNYLEGQND